MIILKDNTQLLDSKSYKLNLAVKGLNVIKGSKEKLVKTDSDNFNDSYVYRTGNFSGDNVELEFTVRNTKFDEVMKSLFNGNRIIFDSDNNYYREYYVDGHPEYSYYTDYIHVKIPLYLLAFKYKKNSDSIFITNNTVKTINNIGNVYASPVYKIFGTGEVIFSVNGERNVLKNCSDQYIVICKDKQQNVTDRNGKLKNITSDYNGEFSVLKPGENNIQLIKGNRLEIEVNWRWK